MRNLVILLFIVLISPLTLLAQEKTITGNIISGDDNFPMIGATVVVKGTTIGTITDFDGNYSLTVPDDAEILSFSFVGFETQDIAIGDKNIINVTLMPDVLKVDEVVVTAFGIPREAKALGYAVEEVNSDEISRSNNTNVLNSLSGKVAGVQINSSSGAAGSATFVEIRGAASITRSNRPLFIIDGIPVDGESDGGSIEGTAPTDRIGDLNPDDIESVSVLKGGAASALYGMRAANGVIIITTKKGSKSAEGKIRVNVHSSVTFEKISQVPELQKKYVQGSYYGPDVDYKKEYSKNYYRIGSPDCANSWKPFSWGPSVDSLTYTTDPNYYPFDDSLRYGLYQNGGGYDSMNVYMQKWDPNGRIVYKPQYDPALNDQITVPQEYLAMLKKLSYTNKEIETYNPYDFFKTGISLFNSFNISGGDEKNTFYLSYANTNIDGFIPNNTLVKNNFKLSAQSEIFKNFTTSGSVNYLQNTNNGIQQGSNTSGLMLGLLRTPIHFDNAYGYEFETGKQRHYQGEKTDGFDNPYWVVNNITNETNNNRMIGNIKFEYNALTWLTLSYNLGTDWMHRSGNSFFDVTSNSHPDGFVGRSHFFKRELNSDFIINIKKYFSDDFNVTLMLGQNLFERNWKNASGYGGNLSVYGWNNLANSSELSSSEGSYLYRTSAIFGDIGIGIKNMLYINYTGREEWSSTLPIGKNNFYYPSISVGFEFTQLPVLEGNSILPYGKLRASYAEIANDARVYSTYTRIYPAGFADSWIQNGGINFPFKNQAGFTVLDEMGNEDLKPETQKSTEVGINLRFADNILTLDGAIFVNKNEDLLISAPIPPSSGFSTKFMNIGTMETKGYELSAIVNLINVKDFNWEIGVNFENPNTIVTFLQDSTPNINVMEAGFTDPQIHAIVNQPYRMIWGTRWLRNDDGNIVINDDPDQGTVGHPILDENPGIIGKTQPDYRIGVSNTITFKGITIFALLDYKKGGQMWNGTKGALYYYGMHKDTETRDVDKSNINEAPFNGYMGHKNDKGEIVHYEVDGNGAQVETVGVGDMNETVVPLDETWYKEGPGSVFSGPMEQFVEETDWIRLREVSISYSVSQKLLDKTFIKNLEIYFTGKNLWLSTPYTGVDPETNLFGADNATGIDYFNMPGTKTYSFGIKLGF